MGVFCFSSFFSDRPEWGVFDYVFPDFRGLGLKLGITDFEGRKTGLFKPVWLADRFPDGLEDAEGKKACFWDLDSGLVCCHYWERRGKLL